MPQVMILPNGYIVFFYSNEQYPREPVHVHIGNKVGDNKAKIWINSNGKCEIEHNKGKIPTHSLNKMVKTIEVYSDEIVKIWEKHFECKAEFKDQIKNRLDNSTNPKIPTLELNISTEKGALQLGNKNKPKSSTRKRS